MTVDFGARKKSKRTNQRAGRLAQEDAKKRGKRGGSTRRTRGVRGAKPAARDAGSAAGACRSAAVRAERSAAIMPPQMCFKVPVGPGAPPPPAAARSRKRPATEDAAAPEAKRPVAAAAAASRTPAQRAPASPALAPVPTSFSRVLAALGYGGPTAIQARSWPHLEAGTDVLLIAPPGSGKTLAYLLPLAARAGAAAGGPGAVAGLVLCPTRELASQVASGAASVLAALATRPRAGRPLEALCVAGGADRASQDAALLAAAKPPPGGGSGSANSGLLLLVATPGRLLDHLRSGTLCLNSTIAVVLDEVDQLLAQGLRPQLADIRAALPAAGGLQAVLCSATWPAGMEALASEWAKDPVRVSAERGPASESADAVAAAGPGSMAAAAAAVSDPYAAPGVGVTVSVCAEHKKARKLIKRITDLRAEDQVAGRRVRTRVLVFANKIITCDFITKMLSKHLPSHRTAALHGGLPQSARDAALADFKAAKTDVLVATDVAARGLHVAGLQQLVLWDMPQSLEAFTHRLGRAGHLQGGTGHALVFLTRNRAGLAPGLLSLLQSTRQWIDPNLLALAAVAQQIQAAKGGAGVEAMAVLTGTASLAEPSRGGDEPALARPLTAAKPPRVAEPVSAPPASREPRIVATMPRSHWRPRGLSLAGHNMRRAWAWCMLTGGARS